MNGDVINSPERAGSFGTASDILVLIGIFEQMDIETKQPLFVNAFNSMDEWFSMLEGWMPQ